MRLPEPFIRLPLKFDAARLSKEACQFAEGEWQYHPSRHDGNTALPLVSAGGTNNNDFKGKMLPTPALSRCPYIEQVMASFDTVIGRARLMRLRRGAEVPSHSDGNYWWRTRTRIHVPVITDPAVAFSSIGNLDVHMAAGEAWIFDNWRQHAVYNRSNTDRIHLVIDTVGTAKFWELVDAGRGLNAPGDDRQSGVRTIAYRPEETSQSLQLESFNTSPVSAPDEVEAMLTDLFDDLKQFRAEVPAAFASACRAAETLRRDWRALWAVQADNPDGLAAYQLLLTRARKALEPLLAGVAFDSNSADAYEVAAGWLACMVDTVRDGPVPTAPAASGHRSTDTDPGGAPPRVGLTLQEYREATSAPEFKEPVFIVSAPRSGSTMLFEALQRNRDLWSLGDESHQEIEAIPMLHPEHRDYESNELFESDYTPQIGAQLLDAFMSKLQNAAGTTYLQTPAQYRPASVRFLEKTPKNALRIAFFCEMFPDAKFIFLHRGARENIASMIDAWSSQKFVTYRELPGWTGPAWSLVLPSGWRALIGKSIAEVAAWQWSRTNEAVITSLARLERQRWIPLSYDGLLEQPAQSLQQVCDFAGIPFGPRMQELVDDGFALSKYTLTPPGKDKWQRHAQDLDAASPYFAGMERELTRFLDESAC